MVRRRLDPRQRILAAIRVHEPAIRTAFERAVSERADSINLAALASAIEAGDIDRALSLAAITPAELYPLDAAITGAFVAGGQMIVASAPASAAVFGFDGRAVRAEAWARNHVGGLVTGIVEGQREMIRERIVEGLAGGQGPRAIARTIRGDIGLTAPQARSVATARAELAALDAGYFSRRLRDRRFDSMVSKAIRDGKPLAAADMDRIAGRYAERQLKYRSEMIARTETLNALRAGRHEGIAQAVEQGAIDPSRVKRRWSATLDNRTREDHEDMDGQEVDGVDTPFTFPDGSQAMFPGDSSLGAPGEQTINCRCYAETVVDWLSP